MGEHSFDLVVIGGGPGGYVAAIRAAQLGMKTALVESQHLGGICLNWGCIPTKALLRSADLYHEAQNADAFGISIKEIKFDLKKIVERSRAISQRLNAGVGHLLKKNKVKVFDGHGKLSGKGRVVVEQANAKGEVALQAKHIILATGARSRTLDGLEPDEKQIWTYKKALTPDGLPKSLLIVGSGAIGAEFASFYAALGADVTIIEALPRILPVEDEEISAIVHKSFEKRGMTILTSATVNAAKKSKNSVKLSVEQGGKKQDFTAEKVIVAAGIVGNVEGIGLEGTKIKVEKTHILTDQWCRTGEAGVYAIGDIAGPPWLAHKASHEAILCVEAIAGHKGLTPLDLERIPACTYCRPQVASVGLSEAKAKERGYKVKVGRFPYFANGKALAMGEEEGLVKTVFDAKTGELLGAHMVGAEVTEQIQGYSVAKALETTEAELIHSVFPHPTLSEAMHESVLDAFERAIHI
jgi:dihydrolipoamide dehydrogenase